MAASNKRRRRRRSSGALYITLVAAVVVFALIIGMGVFFKVSEIDVTGVSVYDPEDVIKASGIEQGDSIFFIRESAAVINIKALPYIDEVRIVRSLPDSVTIQVTECYPLAAVNAEGSWWIVDKNAKVLEETTSAGAGSYIELLGVEPIMPSVGGTLALGDDQTVKLAYLKEVLTTILDWGYQDEVTSVDMSNISSIKVVYKDFRIDVGKGEDMEDKFWLLDNFFETNGDDGSGRIDLSTEGKLSLIPS